MISAEAIKRGFNRGNYVVGSHTPPYFANPDSMPGSSSLQTNPVVIGADVVEMLREIADEVITEASDVIGWTRDWWARTMIAETSGNPATPVAVIVRVSSVEQVVAVVRVAAEHKIPVTASAGRSNVTGAALPLRGGIVLDLCDLNKVLSYDPDSQIVEVQAGMFGDVFEEHIQKEYGMTMGNWPSSYGVATLGGQAACRGAGQLSTRYGKIEDMVFGMDVVLPSGELVTLGGHARAAIGPDLMQLFIGSEGTLGIITTLRLKLHRLPSYGRAIAYGFDSFADGLAACREILQGGATPAVLRLYDHLESGVIFQLPETNVLLVADEGPRPIVDATMQISEDVCGTTGTALDHDAIFETWLDTRFVTGKSADGFQPGPGFVADTLEMVARWRDLPVIYDEVVAALESVPGTLAGSAHQSHAYPDSACLYFSLRGNVEPGERATWYRAAWDAANAVLIRHDATLSHHHGVGLLRSPYMAEALGTSFGLLEQIKKTIDPDNLFNPGKVGFRLE